MPSALHHLARSLALCLSMAASTASLAAASGTPAPATALPAAQAAAARPPMQRPRIGLVLGGGGAMGAAHIGVFKVLEELHVPVDCIAGTSMGALVGGAYATGMTAAEVEDFIRKIDWSGVFGGKEVRQSQTFMRKEQTNRYSNNLEFTIKGGGLSMPAAIVPTQEVESLIRQLVSDYRGVSDFDKLPIPFRSVATDLKSGKPVVFKSGELPVAMRASMSVPGVFSPVEVGDTLLADGGLVDNLPVDVARNTCADIVIAVDVDSPPPDEESMRSATGTFSRMLDLMVDNNEQAQWDSLRPEDVGIHVLLETVGSGSFDKAPEAIPVGEASARAAIDSLRRYSISAEEYANWRASLHASAPPHVPRTVGEIRVAGLEYTSPEYVKSLIDSKPGDPVNEEKVADDALRIFATGDFQSVNYRFEGPAAAEVVVFEPVERRSGETTLGFDFGLESATHGDMGMVLRADLRHRLEDAHGSHWRATAQLGRSSLVSANYVRSLDVRRRSFADFGIQYRRDIEDYYAGSDLVVRYLEPESGVNLDLGHALGQWGEARVGMFAARQSLDIYVGLPILPELNNYQDRGYRIKLTADTRDKNEWATRGFRLTTLLQSSEPGLGADEAYTSLLAEFTTSRRFGRNLWFFNAAGGTDFDTHMPVQDYFSLGGPEALTGLSRGQLRGPEFAYTRLGYGRELTKVLALFDQSLYGGVAIEGGNVWKRVDGTSGSGLLWGAHLFVGGSTPIGPVGLDFGYLETGDKAVFLRLGAPVYERFR